MEIDQRAQQLFEVAREQITKDCKALHADHAAKSLLRSGSTAKAAIAKFEERSQASLDQLLSEIGAAIDHRGRSWTKSMDALSLRFAEHMRLAPEILAPSFQLAGIGRGSSQAAVDKLIAKVGSDLETRLQAYRDGWTAPQPKRWHDRHPAIYAILLLVAGAAIGLAASAITAKFERNTEQNLIGNPKQ